MERTKFAVTLKPLLPHILGVGTALFIAAAAPLGGVSGVDLAAVLAAAAVTALLHEGVHALTARLLGVKVSGFGLARAGRLVVGAYVSFAEPMPLRRWIPVALAPLALSPALLALARAGGPLASFLSWLYLLNAVGSCGDAVLVAVAASLGGGVVTDAGDKLIVEGGRPRRWALILLDAVAAFFLAHLVVLAAQAPITILASLLLDRTVELSIAGLTVVRVVVEREPCCKFASELGPGFLLVVAAAVAAFEAALGNRRVEKLLEAFSAESPAALR